MAQENARPKRAPKKKDPEAADATAPVKAGPRRTRKGVEVPTSDSVAFHAYLMWERGEPGDATEHWLRAERELTPA